MLVFGLIIGFIGYSQNYQETQNMISKQYSDVERNLINTAPTNRLKSFLQSFPPGYVVTREWYEANKSSTIINDFTDEETLHFAQYVKRFRHTKYE